MPGRPTPTADVAALAREDAEKAVKGIDVMHIFLDIADQRVEVPIFFEGI